MPSPDAEQPSTSTRQPDAPAAVQPRRAWWRRPVAWIVGAPPALLLLSLLAANAYILPLSSGRTFDTVGALSAHLRDHPFPEPPVAILLGAHVQADGEPSPALTDRLAAALDLYDAHLVRAILISGDNGPASQHETDIMRAWLIARGVPPDALWTDPLGVRTLDTMARAAQVFHIHYAVVCTQGFHQPRSLFLARAFGIEAVGLASDRQPYRKAPIFWAREQLARALSIVDVHILHTPPAHRLSTDGVIIPDAPAAPEAPDAPDPPTIAPPPERR